MEAQGEARARPDVMTILAGVVATGATTAKALRANAELFDRLLAAVRAAGVAPSDLQTPALSVQPRFAPGEQDRAEHEDWPSRIVGYVAGNRKELRLRDLRCASALIEALFAAGANEVRGPTFSFADDRPQRRAAERAAVAEARAEAEN